MEKNGQTIRVLDKHGTVIGYTYPKRAKGLVKSCRAEFVTDREIRLYEQCPTYEYMEDKQMDELKKTNYITINPREWFPCPDIKGTHVWDRFAISHPLAGVVASAPSMAEVLSVGTFDWKGPSHMTNGCLQLEQGQEYHLVFWLNGGENDRSDETCMLQIFAVADANSDFTMEYVDYMNYRLNRNYIKPLKKYQGWEYYDIPFTTSEATYVQFRFVAEKAPLAVMAAEGPEAYAQLEDMADPFEDKRPQRHNIFFRDGWPTDKWYSTENLMQAASIANGPTPPQPGDSNCPGVLNQGMPRSMSMDSDQWEDRMDDFEDRMDDFEEQSDAFEERMEAFGIRMEEFGRRMEAMAAEMEKRMNDMFRN
ncbi:MAG: hypothetical protein IJ335_11520 [Lachnospiraceae bacterium]|nr:hypothetical protein [Lachnospiraceae bacterium]